MIFCMLAKESPDSLVRRQIQTSEVDPRAVRVYSFGIIHHFKIWSESRKNT